MGKTTPKASHYRRAYEVLKYLRENTDENHRITQRELLEAVELSEVLQDDIALRKLLKDYVNITAENESNDRVMCDNIDGILNCDFDDKNIRLGKIYYQHIFTEEDIDVIIESLRFSKSIDTKQADEIINKIKNNLCTKFYKDDKTGIYNIKEIELFNKQMVRDNLIKIQTAIDNGSCIKFIFNGYDSNKVLKPVREEMNTVTPYYIVAYNSRYYLIASTKAHKTISIWRVDLMTDLVISNQKETKENYVDKHQVNGLPLQWDNDFIYHHLNMSYDEPKQIKLKISKNKKFKDADYTYIFDWFGKSFKKIESVEAYDIISVKCSPFAIINWALQYSDRVEILEPAELRNEIKEKINNLSKKYKE